MSFGLVRNYTEMNFNMKKRIDCKSQQNNNPEMERGCGENSEEWWEREAKSRWEGVHRKERQARFPGSCDQLLRGNRQDLTLLIAHCISEDSCLEREGNFEEQKSDWMAWQVHVQFQNFTVDTLL